MSAVTPGLFTIPPHRAFSDALAAGLIARGDRLALAHGIVLLPTNRAVTAITDAFVRRAGGGLLLPRMVAIGDPELGERLGPLLDPITEGESIPPAIDPIERQLLLARLVQRARREAGDPIDAAEAMRLAADLARTLDQLLIEGVAPRRLSEAAPAELSEHWQASLAILETILDRWPEVLAGRGRIDLADRRNRLFERVERRWQADPPPGLVVAAGITTSAPAVARLLRRVALLPAGMVVLPGLDCQLDPAEWESLGPHDPDPDTGVRRPSIETHPQYHLKLLLDRMGFARGEVRQWRWGGGRDAPAARTRAIGHAMAPAHATAKWQTLKPAERRLTGVRATEFAAPADEAQGIAIALREAIETPGRTAALVTPDRDLARRVAAHLARWDVVVDDSAGRPLSATAPGTLLLAIAEAAAERFAPVALLALLKHPLVQAGEQRVAWLQGVRRLDKALRGPRPREGLEGIAAALKGAAAGWWAGAAELLAPLDAGFRAAAGLPAMLALLREAAERLAGDTAWAGPAGREAARLFDQLETVAGEGPEPISPQTVPVLLRGLMDGIAVRPPQGGHPRLFIWGLLEARLQQADLMILSGLNEGTWPAAPAPDPWLAPRIRAELGLPGLERRIGLAAHDFALGLGGRQVLVTRSRRDARAPGIASRFWLRIEAMTGGVTRAPLLPRWTAMLARPEGGHAPAERPAPCPPADHRPKRVAVTKLDRLKADPFAFYADAMLALKRWDAVDADPTPAWRGSMVHAVFEDWMREDGCDPERLAARAEALLDRTDAHPVMRALWAPRLREAIAWAAARMGDDLSSGRRPIAAEVSGEAEIDGIALYGKVDRIDRCADNSLAIVDYKTGKPPNRAQVAAGFAMQLGLLGLIAEHGGFAGVEGVPAVFEYWSLASKNGQLGYVETPVGGKVADPIAPEDFTSRAARSLIDAAARWLKGSEPFTAKLHPEHAPYGDYDQLMRLDEWYGRKGG